MVYHRNSNLVVHSEIATSIPTPTTESSTSTGRTIGKTTTTTTTAANSRHHVKFKNPATALRLKMTKKISAKKLIFPPLLLVIVYLCVSLSLLTNSHDSNNDEIANAIAALPVDTASSSAAASTSTLESSSNPESNKRRGLSNPQPPPPLAFLMKSNSNNNNNNEEDVKYFNGIKPIIPTKPTTGSFATCDQTHQTSTQAEDIKPIANHPDANMAVISCREIHYRAPLSQIEKGGAPIVVGVLSGAGGKGPIHRDSIRSTWARDRKGVYFMVAGPWEDIEKEYNQYRDLIWIDEAEVYEGEESVLPFKTEIFIYIMNKFTLPGKAGFEYLFKTDDDSYVDLDKLENTIVGKKDVHYWGCCTDVHFRPLRHPSRKWRITFDLYPEEFYPLYCQGAGFAVSRDMAQCITADDNIREFRYNPFEDVSIGLLAERCGYPHTSDCKLIQQYRTKESGEKKQLNGAKIEEINFLPKATMQKKILQHRVKTHMDMYAHHKCALEDC